jgi:hypothetical protein
MALVCADDRVKRYSYEQYRRGSVGYYPWAGRSASFKPIYAYLENVG